MDLSLYTAIDAVGVFSWAVATALICLIYDNPISADAALYTTKQYYFNVQALILVLRCEY